MLIEVLPHLHVNPESVEAVTLYKKEHPLGGTLYGVRILTVNHKIECFEESDERLDALEILEHINSSLREYRESKRQNKSLIGCLYSSLKAKTKGWFSVSEEEGDV